MAFEIRSAIQNVAAVSWWSVQPPAGEQWILTVAGSDAFDDFTLSLDNGTIKSTISKRGTDAKTIKVCVTNTIYFAIYNWAAATAQNLCYSGVKL